MQNYGMPQKGTAVNQKLNSLIQLSKEQNMLNRSMQQSEQQVTYLIPIASTT